MKNKKIMLILTLVLIVASLSACTNKDTPQDGEDEVSQADLNLDFRYLSDKFIKEDKNYVTMSTEGEDITLEVEDLNLHDSLELEEFYLIAYNDDMILYNIEKNEYLKSIYLSSMKQGIGDEPSEIKSQDKVDISNLTLLDQYIYDFNLDGFDEKISMYTAAQKDEKGNIMWDDGQRWLFVVEGKDQDYVLFDDYVQIGTINYHIYTENDEFNILTSHVGTANLTLSNYKYNNKDQIFIKSISFDTSGNVNMLHSSYGY